MMYMSLNDAMGDWPAVRQLQYRVVLFAIFIGALVSTTTARAQTPYVWNDTTTSWTTPTAWTPNGPANWSDPQIYVNALVSFPSQATINNQPNIDNNVELGGISIDDSQAAWNISQSFGSFNIAGGGLTVTGAGTNTKTGTGTKTTTLSASPVLVLPQTWTIGQGITVAVTNAMSGSGNLTKAGPGTLLLSGTATNTGTITATGGVLVLQGNRSAAKGLCWAAEARFNLPMGLCSAATRHFRPTRPARPRRKRIRRNFSATVKKLPSWAT